MWLILSALALSAPPRGVRPVVAPPAALEAYASFAKERGSTAGLACEPLWPDHALLCFRVWEGDTRRWVSTDDLARWRTEPAVLRGSLAAQAAGVLKGEPHAESVRDMDAMYWILRDGDGWAAAPLLDPVAVAARVGGADVRFALPAEGVFFAWASGNPALDQVMAVAVREVYDASADAVSPMIHVWRGGDFIPWGQARPAPPVDPVHSDPAGLGPGPGVAPDPHLDGAGDPAPAPAPAP